MGTRDPRVDAYIANSAEFAQPILKRLRATVHGACPDVKEDIKWGMPHFVYKGVLCHMAAFKAHCAFGIWHSGEVLGAARADGAMGSFGRITRLADLPPKPTLVRYLKKAKALKDTTVVARRPARPHKRPPRTPADLAAALARNAGARTAFDAMSPSHKREYIEWITGAKREDTRKRRVAMAASSIAEGKSHNWRYERAAR